MCPLTAVAFGARVLAWPQVAYFRTSDPAELKVYYPGRQGVFRWSRKKHRPEEIVAKLREAEAMLNTAKTFDHSTEKIQPQA